MKRNRSPGTAGLDERPYQLPHPVKLGLLVAAMLALTFFMTLPPASGAGEAAISPERPAELAHFVRHDCGSCHGLTLRGGLGPPLTPEALAGKPAVYLKNMILDSRHASAMPAWRPLLTEAEVAWIAEQLLRGLPDAR